jgi:hypothetical protein
LIIIIIEGPTTNKNKRQPVQRIHSYSSHLSIMSNRSISHTTTNNPDITDDDCQLCCERIATYEYDPCQHYPICGECFARLTEQQLETCILCQRPAKIRSRLPITLFQ